MDISYVFPWERLSVLLVWLPGFSVLLVLDQFLVVQPACGAVVEARFRLGAAARAECDQAGTTTCTQFRVGTVLKVAPAAASIRRGQTGMVGATLIAETC